MKTMQKTTRVLMIVAALSALALPVVAAETYHYHGDRAWTNSSEVEADGCTFHGSSIDVAHENRHDGPAGAEAASRITFSAYRYSWCIGAEQAFFILYGSADLPRDAFQVQGNLQGATLNATFQITDELSGTSLPVTVALEWTGQGEASGGSYRTRYHDANIFYRMTSTGRVRDAQASGSIVVQGIELLNSRSEGGLSSTHSGSVTRQGV